MLPRLGVTAVCLGLYLLGSTLPLPLLDADAFTEYSMGFSPRVSYFALGVTPFLTGFLIVELFSLLTPPGRRLRHDGVRGRRKLNLGALGLSAAIVPVQAYGIASFFSGVTFPAGEPLTSSPTWLLLVTLTAATFAVAGLAEVLSRYGLANGFAVLLVAGSIPEVISGARSLLVGDPLLEPETKIMSVVGAGLFVVLVVAFLRYRPEARLTTPEGAFLPYRLPPLPQGLVAVTWAYALLTALTQPGLLGESPPFQLGFMQYYGALVVGILAFSALAAWMFSARPRVEANLEGLATVDAKRFDRPWRRQLLLSTLVLAGGEAGLASAPEMLPAVDVDWLRLSLLVPLVAVILDLVDTARLAKAAPLVRVLTLDNVHLAELLRARLRREGIESVVTSFRFRRLVYFFGPLFKMALLVPAEDRDRCVQLIEATPFRIV